MIKSTSLQQHSEVLTLSNILYSHTLDWRTKKLRRCGQNAGCNQNDKCNSIVQAKSGIVDEALIQFEPSLELREHSIHTEAAEFT